MKNIYKSKIAKAYHRHNVIYQHSLLLCVLAMLISTMIAIKFGVLYREKVISDIKLATIIVVVALTCFTIMILIDIYNGSYIEEELSDIHKFAKRYSLIKEQREYKRRERKNKKWLM